MKTHPLTENYTALYLSILWYRELTPEEAFRVVEGKSNMKPECKNITPEMIAALARITSSKNFKNWDRLERRFRINRYKIVKLVRQYRIQQICRTLKQIQQKKEAENVRPVLKYPGSKWNISNWIISNFPANYQKLTYLEPFFGSGAPFFNKKRSVIETINDLDGNVVNLFKVIRDHPEELARLIEYTPWSRDEYKLSYEMTGEKIEDARRFLIRRWQAIGAKSSDITGWRNNIKGNNGNLTQFNLRLPQNIIEASSRLKHTPGYLVQIENQCAMKLIYRHNRTNVFIYCDPPYVRSTRSGRIYKKEMNLRGQEILLKAILKHKGPVMISGYDNELYNTILKGWRKIQKKTNVEGGRDAIETIWMNYDPPMEQLTMEEAGLI